MSTHRAARARCKESKVKSGVCVSCGGTRTCSRSKRRELDKSSHITCSAQHRASASRLRAMFCSRSSSYGTSGRPLVSRVGALSVGGVSPPVFCLRLRGTGTHGTCPGGARGHPVSDTLWRGVRVCTVHTLEEAREQWREVKRLKYTHDPSALWRSSIYVRSAARARCKE